MTELESVITSLIRTVKQSPDFEQIRFINAYKNETAESPVEGFLAVVETAAIDSSVKVNVKLIGGNEITGSQLGYTAVELAAALKKADENRYIENVSLSETKYDKNIASFYRDIKLSLSFGIGSDTDNSGFRLSVNSNELSGVTSFKCEETRGGISLYEFNRGEPYAVINNKIKYEITLEIKSLSYIASENNFTLKIESGSDSVSFLDCNLSSVSTVVNTKGKVVFAVKITAGRRMTV